jgi:hypothetical protein
MNVTCVDGVVDDTILVKVIIPDSHLDLKKLVFPKIIVEKSNIRIN